jgi:hypothetical protein
MMRSHCRIVFAVCLCFVAARAVAQNSTITGEVQDASGAVIRGAEVRVVEQAQGTTRTVQTNSAGTYNAPFLTPGPYRVYIQAPSFSTAVSDSITLTVGQTLVFNVKLQIGSAQQEVTVDAGMQTINTTDGSVGTVIDRKFVENMPLNGRSFQDLISMTPGVVTQSPQTAGQAPGYQGDFSVNGQRTESNSYTVDGVSGNVSSGVPRGYIPSLRRSIAPRTIAAHSALRSSSCQAGDDGNQVHCLCDTDGSEQYSSCRII